MTSRLSIILLVGLLAMATARLHPDHVDDKTVAERLAAGVDKVMERIRLVAAWKKIIEKTQHVMGGAGAGALPTIAPDFVEFDN
ncbi:unnamed protein product, partial [Mesorhabditis spiculigera]